MELDVDEAELGELSRTSASYLDGYSVCTWFFEISLLNEPNLGLAERSIDQLKVCCF